ncbi:NAD(P)H-hydrate dehydratase [bacterium]|nr:NAD(P)H-hydrate dehydratase [bacterium]
MAKYITIEDFKNIMPPRPQNSNKGTFGRVLNIAGSINNIGASVLSSVTPLKTGAGLVTLACPKVLIPIVATKLTEATFLPLDEPSEVFRAIKEYDVISLGCGLGTSEETTEFIKEVLKTKTSAKWVIDADALNIISKENIKELPENSVLTPHPKEMARLLNCSIDEIQENREESAIKCAKKFKSAVLLKGQNTVVTDGSDVYINKTGSSALAKAGSGDVLTGIISGLIAQGQTPFEAGIKGAYLHGLTGELAGKEKSEYSVLAGDLIDYLPKVILNNL